MVLLLSFFSTGLLAKTYPVEQTRIEQFFPGVVISKATGPYQVRTLSKEGRPIGYAFQTIDVVNIPAYSGKPINMQILLDPKGVIVDAYVLEHHEPILLIGIPEAKLHGFNARYAGVGVNQRVVWSATLAIQMRSRLMPSPGRQSPPWWSTKSSCTLRTRWRCH